MYILTMYLTRLISKVLTNNKTTNVYVYRCLASNNPYVKSWDVIKGDLAGFFRSKKPPIYPEHVDIVVVGGGFIGSSVAYWLKKRTAEGLSVLVLEKDFSYKSVQDNASYGMITQHFSLPENVHLSKFSGDFMRNIKEHLGSDVDIQFKPCSNLVLASEKYAEKLEHNVTVQREHGLRHELLSPEDITQKYPWISTHDVKLGCIGNETEGFFNTRAFLQGLITKSQELGATYVNAEVIGFELEKQRDVLMEGIIPGSFERVNKVIYRTPDNEEYSVKFAACILAAGDDSGQVAKLAKIGNGEGLLSVPLPIEKREYDVYSIEGKAKITGLNTPMLLDTSGLWLRRNGIEHNLLCGHIPLVTEETRNFSKEEYYTRVIKPSLDNRFPNFENTEIVKLGTEKQDCNLFDETGILGPHPYHNNLYIATGFGRHGCLHAPGIGRAIAELIIDSHYATIDLTRYGFDRMLTNQPLVEFNIY